LSGPRDSFPATILPGTPSKWELSSNMIAAGERLGNRCSGSVADQVVEYVERNYRAQISLRDVAQAVGYSACHLTTAFRRARGLPVTAWIVRRRIIAAQELLSVHNMTVARASAAVGFTDLCYFTRQFARHVGITPGRFRSVTNKANRSH
jgi:AraC-like DNA-binding protein